MFDRVSRNTDFLKKLNVNINILPMYKLPYEYINNRKSQNYALCSVFTKYIIMNIISFTVVLVLNVQLYNILTSRVILFTGRLHPS